MEILALEKADKLLRKENQSRRKLRQIQVREQSNEWMERNRKKYLEEKDRQIQQITESLTLEAQNNAVKQIERMEKMHDLCSAQVGEAHRAAAGLPDFEMLQSQKNHENLEKAKDRGAQALAQEKLAAETALRALKQARILRENIRQEEDYKFKEFVAKSVHTTKSQAAVDRIVDKLTNTKTEKKHRPEYQPSLAKTLRVPKVSHSEEKLSKTKKHTRLSRKSKDVAYYDSSIPRNTLKYTQPPGLVQKHTKENQPSNAFEAAQRISAQQEKLDSKKKLEDSKKAKEAQIRGKTALKVAKLQRQLDQITNEFEADGFIADPVLNDSFLGLSDSEIEDTSDDNHVVHPQLKNIVNKQDQESSFASYKKQQLIDVSKRKVPQDSSFTSHKKPQSADDSKRISQQDQETSLTSAKILGPSDKSSKRKTESLHTGKSPLSPLEKQTEKHPEEKLSHQESTPTPKPPKKVVMSDSKDPEKISTSLATSPAKKPQQALAVSSTSPGQYTESSRSELEKPKLISTRKSIRQQQSVNMSGSRAPSLKLSDGKQDTNASKNATEKTGGPIHDGIKNVSASKSTPKSKLPGKEKEKDSSSSMHTMSSASPENASDQPVTDYFSPPDHSKSFPLTSTPAEDGLDGISIQEQNQRQIPQRPTTSVSTSSKNTTTDGTVSPKTAAKRKQALHYYVTKLLQMRPESMCDLHASSSTSVSSYVEIPTSAVTSIIGSDPPSASTSDYSIPSGLASWRTACPENGTSVTNPNNDTQTNTSNSYNNGTTLSSVTEEDEGDGGKGIPSDTADYESDGLVQVSSGETLAKVTFALNPRSPE